MINDQNKSKVFIVVIAILLIANIGILAFFLQEKTPVKQSGHHDRKAFIANFLKTEIGFDQQQLIQYDSLSDLHHGKIKSLYENARNKKNEHFKQLVVGNFSDSAIELVAGQSAAAQKIMEVQTFNHIKNIRRLCTPGQLPVYDSLFWKVFNKKGERKSGK